VPFGVVAVGVIFAATVAVVVIDAAATATATATAAAAVSFEVADSGSIG